MIIAVESLTVNETVPYPMSLTDLGRGGGGEGLIFLDRTVFGKDCYRRGRGKRRKEEGVGFSRRVLSRALSISTLDYFRTARGLK